MHKSKQWFALIFSLNTILDGAFIFIGSECVRALCIVCKTILEMVYIRREIVTQIGRIAAGAVSMV